MKKVIFLDRDGVINVDVNYLYRIEDLTFMPGAAEALALAVKSGYELIVVTNQSGVARGYYTEDDVKKLHAYMGDALAAKGAPILQFYYCPHHEKGTVPAYTKACDCRKPKPGMILKAMEEYAVDRSASFLIGDKPSDVEAAHNAGIDGYLFEGDDLLPFMQSILKEREGKQNQSATQSDIKTETQTEAQIEKQAETQTKENIQLEK
ncbi:MAG: HAD family hydrolase [Veillonella sp.]|nr:HAD family hydrolase [Veillonella sp.]